MGLHSAYDVDISRTKNLILEQNVAHTQFVSLLISAIETLRHPTGSSVNSGIYRDFSKFWLKFRRLVYPIYKTSFSSKT